MDSLRAEFAEVACWPPATAAVAFFAAAKAEATATLLLLPS